VGITANIECGVETLRRLLMTRCRMPPKKMSRVGSNSRCVAYTTMAANCCDLALSSLPREILQLVLSHLNALELVKVDMSILCHSFRPSFLAAMDGLMLWHDICVYKKMISWFLLRNTLFSRLELSHFNEKLVTNSRHTIKYLSCSDRDLTDDNVSTIGACPRLIEVEIFCKNLRKSEFLAQFFSLNPQILTLTIHDFGRLDANILSIISRNLPNLEHINLSESKEVTDNFMTHIVPGFPNLISINLNETKITDASLRLILDNFPNLRSLLFQDCRVSHQMLELCILRFPIPAILSEDLMVQTRGLEDLTSMLEYLHGVLVSALVPLSSLIFFQGIEDLQSSFDAQKFAQVLLRFLHHEDKVSSPRLLC
jgi:hypothetical protein